MRPSDRPPAIAEMHTGTMKSHPESTPADPGMRFTREAMTSIAEITPTRTGRSSRMTLSLSVRSDRKALRVSDGCATGTSWASACTSGISWT
jgi:hypothetical protein